MEVLLSAFVECWSQAAIDSLLFLKVKANSKNNFILLKTWEKISDGYATQPFVNLYASIFSLELLWWRLSPCLQVFFPNELEDQIDRGAAWHFDLVIVVAIFMNNLTPYKFQFYQLEPFGTELWICRNKKLNGNKAWHTDQNEIVTDILQRYRVITEWLAFTLIWKKKKRRLLASPTWMIFKFRSPKVLGKIVLIFVLSALHYFLRLNTFLFQELHSWII